MSVPTLLAKILLAFSSFVFIYMGAVARATAKDGDGSANLGLGLISIGLMDIVSAVFA